jgi:hypothetical protein
MLSFFIITSSICLLLVLISIHVFIKVCLVYLVYADLWNSKCHTPWSKTDTSLLCFVFMSTFFLSSDEWTVTSISNMPQDSDDDKLHMKSVNGLFTQNTIRTVAGEISDSCLRLLSMESLPYNLLGFSSRVLEMPWHTWWTERQNWKRRD